MCVFSSALFLSGKTEQPHSSSNDNIMQKILFKFITFIILFGGYMKHYIPFILIYWAVISLVSVIITIKDKRAAVNHKWRVPEATLMLLGFLGGAEAMLLTMKIIRHKTKHLKFMLGLPAEIILHIALILFLFYS